MIRDLRIIFMGTPEFAVASLNALIENNFNVVGVITAADKPAGRGRKLNTSAVKQFALEKGLPVLQPKNLKNEKFLDALKALEPNLQIVVAFRMLPKIIWQLPEYGTFNLHASLLPQYRGAAPINWAIINGETVTGVTTFFIDEKIDTGEIILQKEVSIEKNDTAGNLHDKLMVIGSALVIETVEGIAAGTIKTFIQPTGNKLKAAPKLNSENCKLDWRETTYNLGNKIRGLSPYPVAWCELLNGTDRLRVKIYDADIIEIDHDFDPGHLIISKNEIKVAARNGVVSLKEIQVPGKRRMDIKSLINGFHFETNAKML